MPIVKIDQKGYEKFSDFMCGYEFKDGVSIGSLSQRDAERLGSLVRIVNVDDNLQINRASSMDSVLRPKVKPAQVEMNLDVDTEAELVDESSDSETYTEAQLAAIASSEGLLGLRLIGDPLGVKATSISKMIQGILQAQK